MLQAGLLDRANANEFLQDSLPPLLETMAERALQKPLRLCQSSAEQLLKNGGENLPTHRREPVAAYPGPHLCDEYLSLAISD